MKNYLKLIALFVFLIPFTGNAESSISNDCYTFTKYLSVDVGVSSADVAALKKVLIKEKIIDSNFKSTVYDENFASAVIDFQMKNGIQKTGTVGPVTRAKLNGLYGCSKNNVVIDTSTYSATFQKDFLINSEKATIYLAVDNRYSVTLNNKIVETNNSDYNFLSFKKIDLSPYAVKGKNTIKIKVINPFVTSMSRWEINPAGLIYIIYDESGTIVAKSDGSEIVVSDSGLSGSAVVLKGSELASTWIMSENANWIWNSADPMLANSVYRKVNTTNAQTSTYSPSYSPTYKSTPTSISNADKKIEVLTPTNSSGVNSFEPGNTIKFNWSQSGIKGIKKIILVSSSGNDNIYVLNLSSISNPLTTGTYNWIVPSSVKAGMYRVRIISDTSDVMGESSAKIIIRNSSPVTVQKEADKVSNSTASYSSTYTYTPSSTYTYTPSSTYTEKPKVEVVKSVTVLTPSGANGNKFNRGESMKIAWSSTGVRGVSLIKLISSTNSNATHTVLDLTSPNSFPLTTDSYSWTIPTSINSGEYYVYVQIGNDSTAISNKSSGKITILEK